MPLYDETVKREVAEARRLGLTGDALTNRVAAAFKVDEMSVIQANMLADAFERIVRPAARPAKDGST